MALFPCSRILRHLFQLVHLDVPFGDIPTRRRSAGYGIDNEKLKPIAHHEPSIVEKKKRVAFAERDVLCVISDLPIDRLPVVREIRHVIPWPSDANHNKTRRSADDKFIPVQDGDAMKFGWRDWF